MPVATLIVEYDLKTKNMQIKCNPGSMLDEDRGLVYLMMGRVQEELIIRRISGAKTVSAPSPSETRPFGKGVKTETSDTPLESEPKEWKSESEPLKLLPDQYDACPQCGSSPSECVCHEST